MLPVSLSPKFQSVSVYDQLFLGYMSLWDKCTEWPKRHKFQSALIYEQRFWWYMPFESSAPNDPKMTLGKIKGTPYMHYYHPWVPNFSPFRSSTSRFWLIEHFETSSPNYSKMTFNTTRSKVPHTCITSVPDSQISVRFALQSAFVDLDILRQVHPMTPKWPWTLQGQRYPMHVLFVSLSPKFQSIWLCDQLFFELQAILRYKCTEWP